MLVLIIETINFSILLDLQTSSVEIERVCDRSDERISETAAVSVAPVNGGPEQLVIYVVLKKGFDTKADELKAKFSIAIHSNLNPLFKVSPLILYYSLFSMGT